MSITPFIKHFVEESLKKQSIATLLDADINKACLNIVEQPIDISPKGKDFFYQNPKILYVYPSKEDSEDFILKGEQIIESIHGIKSQAAYEIKGNKEKIQCLFYGEESDLAVIDSAVRNFYPKTFTELSEKEQVFNFKDLFIFDFIPEAPFYKAMTPPNFTISPLNIIPELLSKLNDIGTYQVLFKPLEGIHDFVSEAIDTEWRALQGIDKEIPPSLYTNAINKKLEYKSPDFKSYYSLCVRIIIPDNSLIANIRAFISNFLYGKKSFITLDNQNYSEKQIQELFINRACLHTGFLVNSHELASFLHFPFQILLDKAFRDIFLSCPCGDKPIKTAEYEDVIIGTWACGSSTKEIRLPVQKENPHAVCTGLSRSGKSILIGEIAIRKFEKGESVIVLDPHGDLIENILRKIPKNLIDKVIVIDFGRQDATPQIVLKDNLGDLSNPSKISDDLTDSFREATGSKDFWGPRLSYYLQVLSYIFAVTEFTLPEIRQLLSMTTKGKSMRTKIKALIDHPIINACLDDISNTPYESLMPVISRISYLLLSEQSLRLFTLKENKISISNILENNKLCLINLSLGILGKTRSSILSGLMDSLISNNIISRAKIPYHKKKPVTLIKDEFYLSPTCLDTQFSGLAKYGLSVIVAHQYLKQVEGQTREVLGTAGTRICFRLRRADAEIIGREFNINPEELTDLKKF